MSAASIVQHFEQLLDLLDLLVCLAAADGVVDAMRDSGP